MSVRVTCDCSRVACGSDSSGTEESDSESSESLDDCSPLWAQTDVGDTEAVDSVAANAGALARPVIATATAGASTRREVRSEERRVGKECRGGRGRGGGERARRELSMAAG